VANKKKFFLVWCVLVLSLGVKTYAQSSSRANFGNYPADYGLAYWSMIANSQAPTIRGLFGSTAVFATSLQGMPTIVTLESASGNRNEFTANLLLSVKNPDTGVEQKVLRMQVSFQADSMTEKSYVRYVKLANLVDGKISEQRSRGGEMEDGGLFGFFAGVMGMFWDTSVLPTLNLPV
jgi:hypothetical protein